MRKCFENLKTCLETDGPRSRPRPRPPTLNVVYFFENRRSWPDGNEESELNRDFSELERFISLAGWINEKPRCIGRAKPQNSCHTHGPLLRSFHSETLAEGSSSCF